MSTDSSNELVKLIKEGDTEAVGKLYEMHRTHGISVARKRVGNTDDAEDIYQDSFLKAIEHLDSFDGSRDFTPWFDTIIINTAKNFLTKKKATSFSDMSGDEDDGDFEDTLTNNDESIVPESAYDRKEMMEIIGGIVGELPEAQRTAVTLFYFKDMSIKQIAALQEVSEDTVKSRLNYARKKVGDAVTTYEKKHGIKLHGTVIIPALLALFFKQSSYAAVAEAFLTTVGLSGLAGTVGALGGAGAIGTAGALGTAGVAGTAGGAGSLLAGGLFAKVAVAAVAALTITGGGIYVAVTNNDKEPVNTDTAIVSEISGVSESALPGGAEVGSDATGTVSGTGNVSVIGEMLQEASGSENSAGETSSLASSAEKLKEELEEPAEEEDLQEEIFEDIYEEPKNVDYNVGSIRTMGTYEQDNNSGNGPEIIDWIVAKRDGNKALLVSRNTLDVGLYSSNGSSTSWKSSEARRWTTNMYNSSFTAEEKQQILLTTVSDPAISGENGDKKTVYVSASSCEDYLFLLSASEVNEIQPVVGFRMGESEAVFAKNGEANRHNDCHVPGLYPGTPIGVDESGIYYVTAWTRTVHIKTKDIVLLNGETLPTYNAIYDDWFSVWNEGASVQLKAGYRPAMWITVPDGM